MGTIELFTPSTHPDGWRRVVAPGGYEAWRFSVVSGDVQLIAALQLGSPADARYVKRYRAYRAWPTRVAPPLPAHYPSVALTVVRGGRVVCRMMQELAAGDLSASTDAGKVRMGASHLATGDDGAMHLSIRGLLRQRTVTADLVFRPRAVAPCDDVVDGPHHVAFVAPLCEVDGEIDVFGEAGGASRVIAIDGLGAHTHAFGTRMIERSVTTAALVEAPTTTNPSGAGRAVLVHAIDDHVHVTDVSADHAQTKYSVVKEHVDPFPLVETDVSFAKRKRWTARSHCAMRPSVVSRLIV